MERRRFLTLGSGPLFLLSGCMNENPTEYGLAKIHLSNRYSERRTVSVTVTKEGQPVYDGSHTIEPGDQIQLVKSWMGNTVDYTVTVSISEENQETVSTADLSNQYDLSEDDCFTLEFVIQTTGDLTTFLTGSSCNPQTDS